MTQKTTSKLHQLLVATVGHSTTERKPVDLTEVTQIYFYPKQFLPALQNGSYSV